MTFKTLNCPTCDEPAKGTYDRIPGIALFSTPDEDGSVDYEGETEIDWDGQITVTNKKGESLLICPNCHIWYSAKES